MFSELSITPITKKSFSDCLCGPVSLSSFLKESIHNCYITICIYVCTHIWITIYMITHMYKYDVYIYTHICKYVYIYIYIYIYILIFISIFTFVFICICIYITTKNMESPQSSRWSHPWLSSQAAQAAQTPCLLGIVLRHGE